MRPARIIQVSVLVLLALPTMTTAASGQDCEFAFWRDYEGAALMRHATADVYLFVTDHMRVDADGAPNAYHPDDLGLDFLANAGYPDESWWPHVLVADPADPSVAFVQTDGPFAGFFVSQTALEAPGLPATDPARYVDATRIPYLVFPGAFASQSGTGRLGDFGYAMNLGTGDATPFIVADIGPSDAALGEVSIALAEGLGGADVNPRNGAGAPRGEMLYVVFRFSSPAQRAARWPVSLEAMTERVDALLAAVGGGEGVKACAGSE